MIRGARLTLFLVPLLAAPALADADGTILSREVITLADDLPERLHALVEGVTLERIIYVSAGLEVEGYLAYPTAASKDALPCVVYCRGGNRDFGGLDNTRAAFMLGESAQAGYVVVASNYRGNGELGARLYPPERTCPEGEPIGGQGREEFGGAEVNDVLALIPLLESLPQADADRIGIYGWSRGGMMTYLALRASDRFKAAIVGAGMADMRNSGDERPAMIEHVFSELIPGWADPVLRAQAIESRSAVLWADELPATTPILILHGSSDWRVSPRQALAMSSALYEAQKPHRLLFLEGGDHGLSEHRDEVKRQVHAWLNRYVRDGEALPNLEPHGR
jgi:dipeptidyl aminopeptidase/acylaminoacyl peptidase